MNFRQLSTQQPRISQNFIWNLCGSGLPIIAAIVTIPLLIQELGNVRFGFLTLAWMTVGYFSLFDFGLGRALTKILAEMLGRDTDDPQIPSLIWTSLSLLALLGLVAGLVAWQLCPWLVHDVLDIPDQYRNECLYSAYLLAASLPMVITKSGLVGTIEAYQRFDILNVVRIPLGISNFIVPLIIVKLLDSLFWVVASLLVTRFIAFFFFSWFCVRLMPKLLEGVKICRVMIAKLFRLGSWMTVSNILAPIIFYLDRLVVGATTSMSAVAFYTTPFEMVVRLSFIPLSLSRTLFPSFSATFGLKDHQSHKLFVKGQIVLLMILFPMALVIVTLANEGLDLWLGSEFAKNSTLILQFLVTGICLNGSTQLSIALIQGAGKPNLTAKLHLIELIPYILTLWFMLGHFGLVGAAVTWVVRTAVEAVTLLVISCLLLKLKIARSYILIPIICGLMLFIGGNINEINIKILFLVCSLSLFYLTFWLKFKNIFRQGI